MGRPNKIFNGKPETEYDDKGAVMGRPNKIFNGKPETEYDDVPESVPSEPIKGTWINVTQEEVEQFHKDKMLKGFKPFTIKEGEYVGKALLKEV